MPYPNNFLFFVPPFGKDPRYGGGLCLGRSGGDPFQGRRTEFAISFHYNIFSAKSQ